MSAARIAVASGTLVTVKAWVKRSNSSNIGARLRIPARMLGGIGTSDLTAAHSAGSNTYQELTLTFTPTESGVVEVFFDAYTLLTSGTPSDSAWIDDMTITQA